MLAARTGLRWQACEAWMRHAGLTSIMDLMQRYPGLEHAAAMQEAGREVVTFILEIAKRRPGWGL
jgi:hypothetical protein